MSYWLKSTAYSFFRHRELLWEMVKRDLKGLTKGSVLGYLWIILVPLIQVSIYVIVVSFVFRARLNENAGVLDYALYVLSGLIPWQIITRAMGDATSLIRDRTELLKQVIYPIETLPLTNMLVASFGSFVSLFLFIILAIVAGQLRWTFILLPIPLIVLVVFILGVSWFLSIVGVILKDIREFIALVMGALMYVSPVIASESMVGTSLWRVILLNPLAHMIIAFRDVFNAEFHLTSWLVFVGTSLLMFFVGSVVMWRARLVINDYI